MNYDVQRMSREELGNVDLLRFLHRLPPPLTMPDQERIEMAFAYYDSLSTLRQAEQQADADADTKHTCLADFWCGLEFKNIYTHKGHSDANGPHQHGKELKYRCLCCPFRASSQQILNRHYKRKIEVLPEPFKARARQLARQ